MRHLELTAAEKERRLSVLAKHDWNISRAAAELGQRKEALYRWCERNAPNRKLWPVGRPPKARAAVEEP